MASAHGGAGSSLLARIKSGLNFSFSRGGGAIGLSIGASSIKLVELKKQKKNWTLHQYASFPIHDCISDAREITDASKISQGIQALAKETKISTKQICSAVIGNALIVKNLTIAVTDMKELQDQVFWEAEQYIPFDITEVVIDFQVVSKNKDNQVEVILVAVKKDFLEQYMGVIQDAKLEPTKMDTEFFALQNTFELNYQTSSTEAMLLADIGAVSTKIVICSNGTPHFMKDAAFGGNMITQEIQRELKLSSSSDAEALKVSANLPHEVSEVVTRLSHVLGTEIKKSIDFYTASSLGPPVSAILLSGGSSRAFDLSRIVEEYTQLPTQLLNPFQQVEVDSKKFSQDYLMTIAPEAVVPMGLAIRAGEKE